MNNLHDWSAKELRRSPVTLEVTINPKNKHQTIFGANIIAYLDTKLQVCGVSNRTWELNEFGLDHGWIPIMLDEVAAFFKTSRSSVNREMNRLRKQKRIETRRIGFNRKLWVRVR